MKIAPRALPAMIWPASLTVEELFKIIYEDGELLVINKPAGLVCHPTKGDEYSSLISRARLHLRPGSHPQLVNRLDRETSGVTFVAKDADTARELRRIWESRQVEKDYLAIVHGHVSEAHGIIDAPLGKDVQSRVVIKDCVRLDRKSTRLNSSPLGISYAVFWLKKKWNGCAVLYGWSTGYPLQRRQRSYSEV